MRQCIIAAILVIVSSCSLADDSTVVASDWMLDAASGDEIRLSNEVREQPVILFFWASWCPYCKALMPHLQSIRLEHGDDIKILAINFRDDGDPIAFIRNAGYDFVVLPNGEKVAALYDIYGTPGVMIVGADRRIHFDLRSLPKPQYPADIDSKGNFAKGAFAAPYWAAEIRKSVDAVLTVSRQ